MAQGTFYKTFGSSDKTTTRTLLHESIPITGTLVSGTYSVASTGREDNVKSFSHGMFQSVFDYPFLSSSANHIFDITVGIKSGSTSGWEHTTAQQEKKGNIYSQMAQMLMGYDTGSNVRDFDRDGDFSGGEENQAAVFINLSRLLVKDEVKKGSFSMKFGIDEQHNNQPGSLHGAPYDNFVTITDLSGSDSYKVNSPAGEYGLLYATPSTLVSGAMTNFAHRKPGTSSDSTHKVVGQIYYQAGIAVLSSSLFVRRTTIGGTETTEQASHHLAVVTSSLKYVTSSGGARIGFDEILKSETIDTAADAVRNRIANISFNNTTELNSAIYFCRANHNEFNYSSNPTYLTGSKIRVKNNDIMIPPKSYVTTVGLYSADNELLAVAKLSEPLKKDPSNELTLRVRLDY